MENSENNNIENNHTNKNNTTADKSKINKSDTVTGNANNLSTTPLGIAALVVGILAAITSIIPIVNNASPFIAIVGLIFWVPAFIQVKKGKKKGKGLITTAIILNIVAIIITLVMQAACSAVFDNVTNGPDVKSVSTQQEDGSSSKSSQDTNNLTVGTTINLKNGLDVTVVAVENGYVNFDKTAITKVTVTYTNNSKDEISFNELDWKAEDSQGAQVNTTYYSNSDKATELSYGKLSAGGTKTGAIYFKTPIAKIVYSAALSTEAKAKWVVG